MINNVAEHFGINKNKKWKDINSKIKHQIIFGSDRKIKIGFSYYKRNYSEEKVYEGVVGFLKKKLARSDLWQREELTKYLNQFVCEKCNGSRLKSEAMAIKIENKTIFEVTKMSILECYKWFDSIDLKLSDFKKKVSEKIIKEIKSRLTFLKDVGLGYLNLSRSSRTLSGGESQRIRLASQIGSGLTGVLYVLDEPSIGLHQRDNKKLITALKKLRDLGNTIIVVEHDKDIMLKSDYIIDIGPGAGKNGGNVVFSDLSSKITNSNTLTAKYLNGKKYIKRNLRIKRKEK